MKFIMKTTILFCQLLSIFILTCSDVLAYENCNDIKSLYDELKNPASANNKFLQDTNMLKQHFNLKKQFSSGAGGASVYWVEDKNDNNKNKVLKIFKAGDFNKKPFAENNELK